MIRAMKRKLVCGIDETLEDQKVRRKMSPGDGSSKKSTASWLETLRKAKKTCTPSGGARRVHYEFSDGTEMMEEYVTTTGCVSRRAWRFPADTIRGSSDWSVEIGEPLPSKPLECDELRESNDQPLISRRNTRNCLEWRIRNLPYPADVYSVTADADERCITVRTSNKKYFKRLPVPEMDRVGLPLAQSDVDFTHKFNTLIITYKKPKELIACEKTWLEELSELEIDDDPMDGCKPS